MRPIFDDTPIFHTPTPSVTTKQALQLEPETSQKAGTHVQDPVGFVREVAKPMCDEDDRLARPRVAQLGQDVTLGDGIQRRRRFIDDDESGRAVVDAHERARAVALRV